MKLSTCTVSYQGYHEVKGNRSRLKLLETALKKLKRQNVNLATFPGGFLYAKNIEHANKLSERIRRLSKKYNIHVAMGIDTGQKTTQDLDIQTKKEILPLFATILSPDNKKVCLWRQRSTNNKNQSYVSIDQASEERTIFVNKKTIEILMCGEIFNSKIRSSIIERGINTIIDLGHTSSGFRVTAPMKILAKNGIKTFCSVHTQRKNAMKYSYVPDSLKEIKKISTRDTDILIGDSPRIEITVWEI